MFFISCSNLHIHTVLFYSLNAQLVSFKGCTDSKQYRHNQQLEELRNLQDKFSGEKAAWAAMKDQEEKMLEQKKTEILRLQVCSNSHFNIPFDLFFAVGANKSRAK